MMKILAVIVSLTLLYATLAQIPIPNRYDGFSQGDPSSPILFEAFFDLLCPDCAAAWPNIKQVLSYYNPQNSESNLRFYLHTFPLPYHHNAYLAAQGLHVIGDQQPSSTWDYVDLMFDNQGEYWNGPTADDTTNQVISDMGSLVSKGINFPLNNWIAGLNNDSYDGLTRISWKYGCSRGVSGTPFFFVNGILVQADPTWTLSDWRSIIDPLLSSERKERLISLCHSTRRHMGPVLKHSDKGSCPSGTFECDYLPGKFQCCTPGENCIPNVGCRC